MVPSTAMPTLNQTTTEPGRQRGSGKITGSITINKITQGVSSYTHISGSPIQPPPFSPQRHIGANGSHRSSNHPRNYNMTFAPALPLSTGSTCSINIDRTERGYTSIAESIKN